MGPSFQRKEPRSEIFSAWLDPGAIRVHVLLEEGEKIGAVREIHGAADGHARVPPEQVEALHPLLASSTPQTFREAGAASAEPRPEIDDRSPAFKRLLREPDQVLFLLMAEERRDSVQRFGHGNAKPRAPR